MKEKEYVYRRRIISATKNRQEKYTKLKRRK